MIIDKMKILDHLTIQEKYLVDYIINNQEDILYYRELVRKLDVYFQKKLGHNLSNALKNSKLLVFIWVFRRCKYNISFKAFVYALSEAFK